MSKGTAILLAPGDPDREVLREYVQLSREVDDRVTKLGLLGKRLRERGEADWLKLFAQKELLPESPFKLVEKDGASVNFVVTDKTGGFTVSTEQKADLVALLGDEAVASMVEDRVLVELNDKMLKELSPSDNSTPVGELLAARIAAVPLALLADGLISTEQAEAMFAVRRVKQFKPKLLGTFAVKARKARVRIVDILGVLGSAVTRTVKA